MKYHILAFGAGFLLDQIFGDPYFLPHPIRGIGWLIAKTEKALRSGNPQEDSPEREAAERRQGKLLVAILYLRFGQAGGKVLDVDQARSAQTTAFALDEVDVLQFSEQLDRLVLGAAEGFLHFPDGVDDIHSPLLVQPAVLDRQAHAVQQNAVQCPGIGGELPEAAVLEQCLGDAEVGEQLARLTIKVVQRHLV